MATLGFLRTAMLALAAAAAGEIKTLKIYSPELTMHAGESRVIGRIHPQKGATEKNFVAWAMPTGKPLAIHSIHTTMVDENDVEAAPSTVYLHHWIVRNGKGNGPMSCTFNMRWVFGGGADVVTHPVVDFAPGYAYLTEGDETWSAEYHIIDLRGVRQADLKDCYECACFGGLGGSVYCCNDGHLCPSTETSTRKWRARFIVRYSEVWPEATRPLMMLNVAVSGQSKPGNRQQCLFEYDIPASCEPGSACEFVTRAEWPSLAMDVDVLLITSHMHVGGKYLRVLLDDAVVCRIDAHYAAPHALTTPSLQPYITNMSICAYDKPLRLPKGHKVTMEAVYDTHMSRLGVMAYLHIAALERPGMKYANPTKPNGGDMPLKDAAKQMQPAIYTPDLKRECLLPEMNQIVSSVKAQLDPLLERPGAKPADVEPTARRAPAPATRPPARPPRRRAVRPGGAAAQVLKILKAKMPKTAALYSKYVTIKDSPEALKKLQDTASYDQLSKAQSVSCMVRIYQDRLRAPGERAAAQAAQAAAAHAALGASVAVAAEEAEVAAGGTAVNTAQGLEPKVASVGSREGEGDEEETKGKAEVEKEKEEEEAPAPGKREAPAAARRDAPGHDGASAGGGKLVAAPGGGPRVPKPGFAALVRLGDPGGPRVPKPGFAALVRLGDASQLVLLLVSGLVAGLLMLVASVCRWYFCATSAPGVTPALAAVLPEGVIDSPTKES